MRNLGPSVYSDLQIIPLVSIVEVRRSGSGGSLRHVDGTLLTLSQVYDCAIYGEQEKHHLGRPGENSNGADRSLCSQPQTFGSYFESDGILRGEHQTEIIPCVGGICSVRVPAPSYALVFLTEPAFVPENGEAMSQTFMTSFTTKRYNTAAVEHAALETSNGLSAGQRKEMGKASTSSGRHRGENASTSSAAPQWTVIVAAAALAVVMRLYLF